MIGRINYLMRTLVLAALVTLGFLGWQRVDQVLGERDAVLAERAARIAELDEALSARRADVERLNGEVAEHQARIVVLQQDVAERDARIDELGTALRYLKIDRRLARLTVLDQHEGPQGLETAVRFEEVDGQGCPVGEAVEATLPGRMAYVESLVIKFDDDYVEQGDAFRGASLCLFRRLFSEQQRPEDGVAIDEVGKPPEPYTDDRDPNLVEGLWLRFWDYANDPGQAAAAGVRAIHGEAPFIQLRPGHSYLVELRSSGGLSLRAE